MKNCNNCKLLYFTEKQQKNIKKVTGRIVYHYCYFMATHIKHDKDHHTRLKPLCNVVVDWKERITPTP